MSRSMWFVGAASVVVLGAALAGCESGGEAASSEAESTPAADAGAILGRTMTRLDGSEQDLGDYRGRVVLIVNVASRCGLTPQYEQLEALYREKRDDGLVVLGFPANDFMGQEPGTDAEIAAFCSENYGVTFPMFSKISVVGDEQDPLFRELSSSTEAPTWNFTKYLVDREGRLVARFGPRTRPDAPELVAAVDRLLGASG